MIQELCPFHPHSNLVIFCLQMHISLILLLYDMLYKMHKGMSLEINGMIQEKNSFHMTKIMTLTIIKLIINKSISNQFKEHK